MRLLEYRESSENRENRPFFAPPGGIFPQNSPKPALLQALPFLHHTTDFAGSFKSFQMGFERLKKKKCKFFPRQETPPQVPAVGPEKPKNPFNFFVDF